MKNDLHGSPRLFFARLAGCLAPTLCGIALYLAAGSPELRSNVILAGGALIPAVNLGLLLAAGRIPRGLVYGLALSPLTAGAGGGLAAIFGMTPERAVITLALGSVLLAVTGVLAGRKSAGSPEGPDRIGDAGSESDPGLAIALGMGLLAAAGTAWMLFDSVSLRTSWHGLLHASIAYRILDHGLPPENPFFAGEPLIYYWFYHLGGGHLAAAAGRSPLFGFALLNVLALSALFPALYLTGRSAGLKTGAALLGCALGALALNPLGPVLFWLNGPEIALADIAGGRPPGNYLAHFCMGFDFRLASPLTKFWNVSSFAPTLPLFALGLHALLRTRTRPLAGGALIAATLFAMLAVNPLTGAVFAACAGAGLLVWLTAGNPRASLGLAGGLAVACLAAAPLLLSALGGEGGTEGSGTEGLLPIGGAAANADGRAGLSAASEGGGLFAVGLSTAALLGLILAAGPVLIPALFGAVRALKKRSVEGATLGVTCLVLAAGAALLSLPEGNQYKLIRLLTLPAGVLAAGPALTFARRLRLPAFVPIALLAIVILPNSLMALAVYLSAAQAPMPLNDTGPDIVLTDSARPSASVYQFLREETPPDAVVVVHPDDRLRGVAGFMQGDEVPSLARRAIYTGHDFYLTNRHPGLHDRLTRVTTLFAGGEGPFPEPVDDRPLYVLLRRGDTPRALEGPGWEQVFRSGECRVFSGKIVSDTLFPEPEKGCLTLFSPIECPFIVPCRRTDPSSSSRASPPFPGRSTPSVSTSAPCSSRAPWRPASSSSRWWAPRSTARAPSRSPASGAAWGSA